MTKQIHHLDNTKLQVLSHPGDTLLSLVKETIADADMGEDRLLLTMSGGTVVVISDEGQSCCERRYIRTDDDVSKLVGGHLMCIEHKDGPDVDLGDDHGAHETAFVDVATTNGTITLTTHNEHNGYYGGFSLQVRITTKGETQ